MRTRLCGVRTYDTNFIPCLVFLPLHLYLLILDHIDLPSFIIRLYGEVPAEPSVYQYQELYVPGPSKCLNCGQCRPDTSAGKKHIINKHDVLMVYNKTDFRCTCAKRIFPSSEVIPEKSNIEFTHFDVLDVILLFKYLDESIREKNTPWLNAN